MIESILHLHSKNVHKYIIPNNVELTDDLSPYIMTNIFLQLLLEMPRTPESNSKFGDSVNL